MPPKELFSWTVQPVLDLTLYISDYIMNVENVEEVKQAAEQASAAAESTVETAAYSYTASYDDASENKSGLNVLGLVGMILGILSLVIGIICCCFSVGIWGIIFVRKGTAIFL